MIEESTVKTHVKRILMKLRLRDRVQAVIFAYESELTRAGIGQLALWSVSRATVKTTPTCSGWQSWLARQ